MQDVWRLIRATTAAPLLACAVTVAIPALAGQDEPSSDAPADEAPDEALTQDADAPSTDSDLLDWYAAWGHAVRLDVAPGRFEDRDLGAGGLALQWEWWPTEWLAYTTRLFMQTIAVEVPGEWDSPARREATGMSMGLQVGTPGPVKVMGGVAVGIAFVNGRLPPSDRWRLRPVPLAGVLHANVGIALLARPVTLHALAHVHLYSEGPAVVSLSFGGGPILKPPRRDPDDPR